MQARSRPVFVSWSGIAYRATSYDVPLWVNPNRRAGRWNTAGRGVTQYASLDTLTPLAEILRHEDLRSDEDASHYRTTVWQLRVDEGCVVDYSTFEQAQAAGFPPEALVEDDHERCQAEASRLIDQGARGLLSPSAALPEGVNLTLFGPRVPIPWISRAMLASTMPAQQLTTGAPPRGLAERVRFFGMPHSGLAAYRQAAPRSFGA
jgi:RES domain-containing protein